jgi:hypothetical protein
MWCKRQNESSRMPASVNAGRLRGHIFPEARLNSFSVRNQKDLHCISVVYLGRLAYSWLMA